MEAMGKITSIIKGKEGTVLILETDADAAQAEKLAGDLDIKIVQHRKKRSLNANSYYHVLCGKIAGVLGASMTEVCNRMIARYGQLDKDMGAIILRDDIDWQKVEYIHLRPTTKVQAMADGKIYRCYLVMRGSHTYDTKEMAQLINGVVSEAKELEIETMPPAQLAAMLAMEGTI